MQKISIIFITITAFLSYCLLFIVPANAQEQRVEVSAYVNLKEYDATLNFTTTKNQYEFPEVTFNIFVENIGKNYFTPTGTLKIYNSANDLLTQIDLNPDNAIIQPQQSFNFQKKWGKEGLDIGMYHAEVKVYYNGPEPLKSSSTFSFIPITTSSATIILLGTAAYVYITSHMHQAPIYIPSDGRKK